MDKEVTERVIRLWEESKVKGMYWFRRELWDAYAFSDDRIDLFLLGVSLGREEVQRNAEKD